MRPEHAINELYRRVRVLELAQRTFRAAEKSPEVTAAESTTSASFVNLATVGPVISDFEVPGSGRILVAVSALIQTTGGDAVMSFEISGDHTLAPSGNRALISSERLGASSLVIIDGLPEGDITLTAKYRSNGSVTATFSNRSLLIAPL